MLIYKTEARSWQVSQAGLREGPARHLLLLESLSFQQVGHIHTRTPRLLIFLFYVNYKTTSPTLISFSITYHLLSIPKALIFISQRERETQEWEFCGRRDERKLEILHFFKQKKQDDHDQLKVLWVEFWEEMSVDFEAAEDEILHPPTLHHHASLLECSCCSRLISILLLITKIICRGQNRERKQRGKSSGLMGLELFSSSLHGYGGFWSGFLFCFKNIQISEMGWFDFGALVVGCMKDIEIEGVKDLRSPCQITNCVYNMYVCDLMVEENCCSDMDM